MLRVASSEHTMNNIPKTILEQRNISAMPARTFCCSMGGGCVGRWRVTSEQWCQAAVGSDAESLELLAVLSDGPLLVPCDGSNPFPRFVGIWEDHAVWGDVFM